MKFKKIFFSLAAISVLATSCNKPSTPKHNEANKYYNMPEISQEKAAELLIEFENNLEDKYFFAIAQYNRENTFEGETTSTYYGGEYNGHLNQGGSSIGYTFEYEESSFDRYAHDEESTEGNARHLESYIGSGFNYVQETFPSRVAPRYTYKYYYDKKYLCVFAEGTIEGYDFDFYWGVKIDSNGIVLQHYDLDVSRDGAEKRYEEWTVSYEELV